MVTTALIGSAANTIVGNHTMIRHPVVSGHLGFPHTATGQGCLSLKVAGPFLQNGHKC